MIECRDMPRNKIRKKIRVNLELSQETKKTLDSLVKKTNADSMTEVIRRALTIYNIIWTEQTLGASIVAKRGSEECTLIIT